MRKLPMNIENICFFFVIYIIIAFHVFYFGAIWFFIWITNFYFWR